MSATNPSTFEEKLEHIRETLYAAREFEELGATGPASLKFAEAERLMNEYGIAEEISDPDDEEMTLVEFEIIATGEEYVAPKPS